MNKIAERGVKDAKNAKPVAGPIPQEENLQSSFLDPDLSDLESGRSPACGAILDCSGREISGWIVDTRSRTASVSLSLFVGPHANRRDEDRPRGSCRDRLA